MWTPANTSPTRSPAATRKRRSSARLPVRFRLLHAGGNGDNQQVFELSGHVWQAEPYVNNSTAIGDNKTSPFVGVTSGYGATSHFDVVIDSSGGTGKVPGDYVYRSWTADQFQVGFWGLFRVAPAMGPGPGLFPDTVAVTDVTGAGNDGKVTVSGYVTVRPARAANERIYASELQLKADGKPMTVKVAADGRWSATLDSAPSLVEVTSPNGGVAKWQGPGGARPRVEMTALVEAKPGILAKPAPPPPRIRIRNRRHVGLLP
jgi:manganese oxidase